MFKNNKNRRQTGTNGVGIRLGILWASWGILPHFGGILPFGALRHYRKTYENRSQCIRPNYPFINLKEGTPHGACHLQQPPSPLPCTCAPLPFSRILERPASVKGCATTVSKCLQHPPSLICYPASCLLSASRIFAELFC